MSTEVFVRWETTHLVEALYAIRRGLTSWLSLYETHGGRVPDKVVSKPATPKFLELVVPLFRFIDYPGAKALLTPSDVLRAEADMSPELKDAWEKHLASRSGVVFQTKASGYLERRVSKKVEQAALLLHKTANITRADPSTTAAYQTHPV